MKKGTSRISIIIIGVIVISTLLSIVVYNGVYAHKKVFFASIAKSFASVDSKIQNLKINNIVTNKFLVNFISQIDENILTPELREVQRFLNSNKLEGKIDLNKNNLNTSIRLIFNENYNEKLKVHFVNNDLKNYITFYEKTDNEYVEVEKKDSIKLAKALIFSKSRNENTQKIIENIAKEIESSKIVRENERIVIDEVNIDAKTYSIELSGEKVQEVITNSIKNIKKDKKLMIELNDYIALNVDDNKQAEDVLDDLEKTLIEKASKTLKIKLAISLGENNNIVKITYESVANKNLVDNYKIDLLNYKTKNQDVQIDIYKNGNKDLSFVSKSLDNNSINMTANIKNMIVNMLITKQENAATFEYSIKQNVEEKENENELSKVNVKGKLEYLQVKNPSDVSYTINQITEGNVYGNKLDFKFTVDGMLENTDKIDELDKNIMVKKYNKLPIDYLYNRISEVM